MRAFITIITLFFSINCFPGTVDRFKVMIPIKENQEAGAIRTYIEKIDDDSMDLSKNEYANYYYYCAYTLITNMLQSSGAELSKFVVAYIDDIDPDTTTFVLTNGHYILTGKAGIGYYIKAYTPYSRRDASAAVFCKEDMLAFGGSNLFELKYSSGGIYYNRGYDYENDFIWKTSYITQFKMDTVSKEIVIMTLTGTDTNNNGLLEKEEVDRTDVLYGQNSIDDLANRKNNVGAAILRAQTNTRKKHIEEMDAILSTY